MKRLEGRVALVTGASRGIGAAVAMRLATEGATVAVNYAGHADAAAEVVARIEEMGGYAFTVQGDVSGSEACSELVRVTLGRCAKLDILVNNAGITRDGLIVRMSDTDWQQVIDTNLSSAFYMTRAASKAMIKARSGAIVNMSSVVGITGNAGQANYAAAKAGLIGLTKSAARELASRNVRVNAIAPGFIETSMTAALPDAARDTIASTIALRRLGRPEDVAAAVAFLVSDDASYITGHVLAVDGGMTFV